MNDNSFAGTRWIAWCPCAEQEAVSPLPAGTPAPAIGAIVECGLCHCHHEVTDVDEHTHRIITGTSTPERLRDGLAAQGVPTVAVTCAWCLHRNDAIRAGFETHPVEHAVLMCDACGHPSMGVEIVDDANGAHLVSRIPDAREIGQVAVMMLADTLERMSLDDIERALRDNP